MVEDGVLYILGGSLLSDARAVGLERREGGGGGRKEGRKDVDLSRFQRQVFCMRSLF